MKIIVIGGAGFVGSHLIDRLIDEQHEVTCIDNFLSGSENNLNPGAVTYMMSADEINELTQPVDIVFHLGEYSRVEQSDLEPWLCLENTYRTLPAVLRFCSSNNAKLIYSGSSTKFSEATNPYILAKKLNTELVKGICTQYGIEFAITYFYNVYGGAEIEEGRYATVVAKFLKAKRDGHPVAITGDGSQRRHFTHIDDIVNGLMAVADKGNGDGYGIGSEDSVSILELANMIGLDYVFRPDSLSNRKDSALMTEKTKELGWESTASLKDYIEAKINGH